MNREFFGSKRRSASTDQPFAGDWDRYPPTAGEKLGAMDRLVRVMIDRWCMSANLSVKLSIVMGRTSTKMAVAKEYVLSECRLSGLILSRLGEAYKSRRFKFKVGTGSWREVVVVNL